MEIKSLFNSNSHEYFQPSKEYVTIRVIAEDYFYHLNEDYRFSENNESFTKDILVGRIESDFTEPVYKKDDVVWFIPKDIYHLCTDRETDEQVYIVKKENIVGLRVS